MLKSSDHCDALLQQQGEPRLRPSHSRPEPSCNVCAMIVRGVRALQRLPGVLLLALCLAPGGAVAAEALLAVAANFTLPMKSLVAAFERDSGHRIKTSFGGTGALYAQIHNGAPFDALLAADDVIPLRLQQEGLAVAATRFTYAVGKLLLWSPQADRVDASGDVLRGDGLTRIAIANPRLAPYGAAAMQTLRAMGLEQALRDRLVIGENVGQAYRFVASGNVDFGFVAAAQVMRDGRLVSGSAWAPPASMYTPLRQDAVLLGAGAVAARAFLDYLRQPQTQAVLRGFGYETPPH